jgi:predicted ATP-grasp superfamily ATP-dependent carboligase
MSETLLILGASARAAAQSARRVGFTPVCGDLFADLDLRACAKATAVADFPSGLAAVARAAPPGGWMYTGGLENHPALVARIASARPLWGNPATVLRRVRDPFRTTEALRRTGVDVPECYATAEEILSVSPGSAFRGWLRKGRRSSGGKQVEVWRRPNQPAEDQPRGSAARNRGRYFQEWIEGSPCAAVYLAAGGKAILLGVTEQLMAGSGDAGRFAYAGSVGPLPLAPGLRAAFEKIGQTLARDFGLCGLLGVDAVLADERVWPVEINPRYPASAEVLEWSLATSLVGWHVMACREGKLPPPVEWSERQFAKRIHYARADVMASQRFVEHAQSRNAGRRWPAVADIPATATRFQAGQPVVTVLVDGANRAEVLERLAAAENELADELKPG